MKKARLRATPANTKFLIALSVPGLIVFFSLIGADHWGLYGLFATALILAGGVCLSSIFHTKQARYTTGIVYVVLLELVMIFMP